VQVVTNLQSSCNKVVVKHSSRYQDVFALEQVLIILLYKVDDGDRLAVIPCSVEGKGLSEGGIYTSLKT
jgi:hypothetical protein